MARAGSTFNWAIYADATFAGLSLLIPIPLLDVLFEQFFRRRMPRSIARARGHRLPAEITRLLNRWGCSPAALLLFPLWLAFWLLKRLSKKILYFLTVKDAVDSLNYYWHRAFLLDYMLRAGHLDDLAQAQRAAEALSQTLAGAGASPLTGLARQVVRQTRHVLRSLFSVLRRGQEAEAIRPGRTTMAETWSQFGAYLEGIAAQYQATYEVLQQTGTA
ncbi:MAG: hypothetical protein RRC07_16450 [Anaerolineae bacterium]|nr:hypothetical protein [Anaerolineae bacterium]